MVVGGYDIIIVGGGIQGLFLAYYARKKFIGSKIALFESKIVGSGVTAFSAHLHQPHGAYDKKVLTEKSLFLYGELQKEFSDFPIEVRDFVGICKTQKLDSVVPGLVGNYSIASDNSTTGFFNATDEYSTISGMKALVTMHTIAQYLKELIIRMGVRVFEGTTISSVQMKNGSFVLCSENGNSYQSSIVLNASGVSLHKELLSFYPVRSKKIVAFHIDHIPKTDASIMFFFDDDAFLLPQPYFSRYLFSYRCEEWDVDTKSNALFYNKKDLSDAQCILNKYVPSFAERILGGQVFADLYNSPSSSPVILEIETNNILIGATGGSGVRLAPALALDALSRIV